MGSEELKKVAGRYFDSEMKNSNSTDEVSQGLAETHEQVMDNYMEGTVDGLIEKSKGKDIPLQNLE